MFFLTFNNHTIIYVLLFKKNYGSLILKTLVFNNRKITVNPYS